MKKIIVLFIVVTSSLLIGCSTDADVVSKNLAQSAEQFEIYRRVVFYNGITDTYILTIQGYCSIQDSYGQLEVTVKTDDGKYLKHHLGLSDNVTYFSEQIESSNTSDKRYRVIFKPSTIIPNIDVQ